MQPLLPRPPFLAICIVSNSEYTHLKFEPVAGTFCAQFVVGLIQAMKSRYL
jgi:hypothetical protein